MTSCRLCTNLWPSETTPWNQPIFETNNFLAIPSLGSLIEGWLLIVPKSHVISMGALDASLAAELVEAKNDVAGIVRTVYGSASLFEHGPKAAGRPVGCGVDHAHLHVVPIDFDLAQAAAPLLPPGVRWQQATNESCRAAFQRAEDYLYIEQPVGNGKIATHSAFGSQLLRRAIAAKLGIPEQYSWRDYPQLDVVSKTISRLEASTTVVPY